MERLVDKFGLYCQHIHHAVPEIKNSKGCATLQSRFEKLIDAKVLLCSGFFSDILSAAKAFSLTTQKSDIDIIAIVDNVELTKWGYDKLLKKLKGNHEAIREIYEKYKSMPIFESTSLESLQNGKAQFVRYAYRYFYIDNVKPADYVG